MKEKFSPYRGDLSLDRIREELKAGTKGTRFLPVLLIAVTLPFVLAGGFMLLHGARMGLVFILGPAAITGAIYYIEQRMRKKTQEKLWRFDHGEYSPRTMLVTGKKGKFRRVRWRAHLLSVSPTGGWKLYRFGFGTAGRV